MGGEKILPELARGGGPRRDSGGPEGSAPCAGDPARPSTIRCANGPPPRGKLGEEWFAASARRLAGAAGVMFGWRPEEFWAATPVELGALLDAVRGEAGVAPPDPGLVARLKEQFPDG